MATASPLPFTRKNWALFAAGLAVIVLGYVLLRVPPVDGFLSLTLAPILLVVGYCVIVPAAILVRDGGDGDRDRAGGVPPAGRSGGAG